MPNQLSGQPESLGTLSAGVPKAFRRTRRANGKHDGLAKPGVLESAAPSPIAFGFHLKPADVARYLDRFVIGQKEAKKVLSVALCDHFQHVRMTLEGQGAPFYQKQNVLLLGPTGVGKTHLVRSAAELIGVPFVKADATKFSETGYVGGDVDDLVRDLVRRAGGNVKTAEHGIIYLDEVDKLATSELIAGRDVSGRGVQTNLLKLMEDGDVPLVSPNDMTGQLQNAMQTMRGGGATQPEIINTRHILFIVSGAFSGMDEAIRDRLEKPQRRGLKSSSVGREDEDSKSGSAASKGRDGLRNRGEIKMTVDQLFQKVATTDLIEYGLQPEFVGRLPVRVACHGLDAEDLFNVLRKSESSLIHQYERAFAAYGIEVKFEDDGLRCLAGLAAEERTGARGLMTVCERVFRDFKFRLPSSRVVRFTVTADLVNAPGAALRRLLKNRDDFETAS